MIFDKFITHSCRFPGARSLPVGTATGVTPLPRKEAPEQKRTFDCALLAAFHKPIATNGKRCSPKEKGFTGIEHKLAIAPFRSACQGSIPGSSHEQNFKLELFNRMAATVGELGELCVQEAAAARFTIGRGSRGANCFFAKFCHFRCRRYRRRRTSERQRGVKCSKMVM